MLKPEEIVALAALVAARDAANTIDQAEFGRHYPNQRFQSHPGEYTTEWLILNNYVQWMRDAAVLYAKDPEPYAQLSLIEFIAQSRPKDT